MIDQNIIENIANEYLAENDAFLVEAKINHANEIEVIIDSQRRLAIDDCIDLSRWIESKLDREKEDFELSVFTAGIGNPFKILKQYTKSVGRNVCVILKNGLRLDGLLSNVDSLGITLEYEVMQLEEGKKRKSAVRKIDRLLFEDIKSTAEELTIK